MKDFNATQYKNNYQKEKYDRIIVNVPKGKREAIRAYAEQKGMSINGFICAIIDREMNGGNTENDRL